MPCQRPALECVGKDAQGFQSSFSPTWCWLSGWVHHGSAPFRFSVVGFSICRTVHLHASDMSCVDIHHLKAQSKTTTATTPTTAGRFDVAVGLSNHHTPFGARVCVSAGWRLPSTDSDFSVRLVKLGVSQGSVRAACQVRCWVTLWGELPEDLTDPRLPRTPTCTEDTRGQLPTRRAAVEFDGLGVSAIVLHGVAGGGRQEQERWWRRASSWRFSRSSSWTGFSSVLWSRSSNAVVEEEVSQDRVQQ